jgi:hypothetical protein
MTYDDRTHHPLGHDRSAAAGLNFTSWAPDLDEVSNSNPAATLRRHNLIAVTDDVEVAHAVALDFERVAENHSATTTLVLGHAVDREATHEADPEGVATHAARRSMIGGVPGAVVGALVVGLGVWLMTGNGAVTLGGVIGGAIFGFYVSAVWSYVIGTGQSEAYQQSFIDPDAADAILVALHVEDRSLIERARRSVSGNDKVRLYELDERGHLV